MEKDNSISTLLYRISVLQHTILGTKLKQIGVSQDQGRTLNLINNTPSINQTEVAKYLGRSAASTSNLLKGLEKKELIERRISQDSDREKRLQLTAAGTDVVDKIQLAFAELNRLIDQQIEQPTALFNQLNKIINGLKGE